VNAEESGGVGGGLAAVADELDDLWLCRVRGVNCLGVYQWRSWQRQQQWAWHDRPNRLGSRSQSLCPSRRPTHWCWPAWPSSGGLLADARPVALRRR